MQVEYWSLLSGVRAVVNVYENKTILAATDIKGGDGGTAEVSGERDGHIDKDVYVRFDMDAAKLMKE
jgi:hypothetical protein